MARTTSSSLPLGGAAVRRGSLAGVGQRAEEHPHFGDSITLEPVDEGVVRLQCLALAPQRGVFPLGGPPVGSDTELLLELDVAVGGFEERADDSEEIHRDPRESPSIGCDEPRRWNTKSSVKIFARVSWSWSKIAGVMRLTVSTFG
jgi:hypothetical protein